MSIAKKSLVKYLVDNPPGDSSGPTLFGVRNRLTPSPIPLRRRSSPTRIFRAVNAFLLASLLIWLGQLTHIFDLVLSVFRPLVTAIGLPQAAADAFLFGFFRRDYGAARLFDVHSTGAVSGVPLVVAMVTITLFIPCIAQFLVMQKERGLRTALAVSGFILPFAFGVGALLNLILTALEVQI